MLTRLPLPPDETLTLPPISALTTPYTSAPPLHLLLVLQSLRCCGALTPAQHASGAAYHSYAFSDLPTCLHCSLPSLRSWSAFPTCLQCPPHTGLIPTLPKPPQDETTMPPPPFLLCHLQFLRSHGTLKICL
ncbi:hypothetical protein O181_108150 [Austropuccinia psidii MF-1]|uniref:Uncharacterized protein n=1 Tax=Austropuccinia psidii MF-1 TaxID=1389203 RepID=A0A9Q3JVW3_9BASI|nr:hypothetical protein [Austropuccinia psidii MF-1]